MTKEIIKIEEFGNIIYGYYDEYEYFMFHNIGAPAVFNEDETKEWWIHDKCVTHKIVGWLEKRNLYSDNMSEEDKMALSFFMRSLI